MERHLNISSHWSRRPMSLEFTAHTLNHYCLVGIVLRSVTHTKSAVAAKESTTAANIVKRKTGLDTWYTAINPAPKRWKSQIKNINVYVGQHLDLSRWRGFFRYTNCYMSTIMSSTGTCILWRWDAKYMSFTDTCVMHVGPLFQQHGFSRWDVHIITSSVQQLILIMLQNNY